MNWDKICPLFNVYIVMNPIEATESQCDWNLKWDLNTYVLLSTTVYAVHNEKCF